MRTKILEQEILYDGSQLRSHWIYETADVPGEAIVAFVGGCNVSLENMVDLVDRKEQKSIYSESMLHFIAEFFGPTLEETILRQRVLVSLAQQELIFRAGNRRIIRGGNDLWDGDRKLSVSIATASPVSTLIHFGINISSAGTPVPTRGLQDYQIEARDLAAPLLETFRFEVESLCEARAKVKGVP